MLSVIPFKGKDYWTEEISIGSMTYRFRFSWNSSYSYWSLSILKTDGEPFVEGLKVVLGVNLLRQFSHTALPSGKLCLVRVRGGAVGRIQLGELERGDVVLFYTEDKI